MQQALLQETEDFSTPTVVALGGEYVDELWAIESRCYPNPWSEKLLKAEFEKDVSFRLGLVECQQLLAYCFSYLIGEDLHLLNVAVLPEAQGKGLGTRLTAELLLRGYQRGARYVALEVRPSNAVARKLYHRLGFRVFGRRKSYYRDNGEDALMLQRELAVSDLADLRALAATPVV